MEEQKTEIKQENMQRNPSIHPYAYSHTNKYIVQIEGIGYKVYITTEWDTNADIKTWQTELVFTMGGSRVYSDNIIYQKIIDIARLFNLH